MSCEDWEGSAEARRVVEELGEGVACAGWEGAAYRAIGVDHRVGEADAVGRD